MKKKNIVRNLVLLFVCCSFQFVNPCYAQYAPGDDFDGDGIINSIDIDDDNDGVLDADEAPACFYTATEAGVLAKVATGLASSTVNSVAVSTGVNIPTMHDGTSTTVAASNHVVAAGQTSSTSTIIYTLEYPTPVKLSSVSVIGATASWGTGSFAVLEGSTDGITFNDALSAPLATSAATTKVWSVTLNTNNYYQYYRIRVATVGSTTPTFTNYEVSAVLNTSGYIPSAHPKPTCTTDTDNDGIANNFDLDSDGDGCADALEAGATTNTTANYQFPAPYGINGLADAKETVTDNGIINYTSTYLQYAAVKSLNVCADTDGDGIQDLVDIDDDNDGIPDIVEQQAAPCATTVCSEWIAPPFSVTSIAGTALADGQEVTYTVTKSGTALVAQASGGSGTLQCGLGTISGLPDWQRAQGGETVTFTFSKPVTNFEFVLSAIESVPGSFIEQVRITTNNTTGQQLICESCNKNNITTVNTQTSTVDGNGTSPVIFKVSGATYTTVSVQVSSVGGSFFLSYGLCALRTVYDYPYADIDTDGDGVPNRLDLDSDGDGCSDLMESGVSPATDISTPSSTTNAVGGSWGIVANKLTGSQLDPNATDTNNDGLNDSVDPDLNGVVDYTSTYYPIALENGLKKCADTDTDGITDFQDIDDDNDGTIDEVESPACFYTINDLKNELFVSSDLTLSDPISLALDGNTTTWADIAYGYVRNRSLLTFNLPLSNPLPLSTVTIQIGINNAFPSSSFQLQGWNGSSWDVLSASQAMATANTTYTFTNTLLPTKAYNKFRVYGLAGTITNGTRLHEVNITFSQPFVSHLQPKANCSSDVDGDGINNYLDVDSDGDGCSDALESGATNNTTTNYQFPAPYGTNGLADAKETATDNGVINYISTYNVYAISAFLATCTDTDGDGILDLIDIDDDNDGVPDADESPTCYYTTTEAGVLTKVATGLTSSTVNSLAVSIGSDMPTMHDGTSTTVAASNHVVAAGQTSTTSSVIYTLGYHTPVKLSSVSVIGATASWGTGSFAVLEGSTDGVTFNDVLSAPVATSAGTTKTWTVTLNANNYYQYYRIRVSTVGSTTPTFTNYEVTAVLNTSGYISSAHPKLNCTTDTDGDGIINTKDLDSDGDGCADALEASATINTAANYQFPAPYGINGLADAKETVTDNGIINYTSTYSVYAIDSTLKFCTDTDNDGIPDLTDIDDDNDGVPDRTECPNLGNMATGGGFSDAANTISNWYIALAATPLPITSPVTPAAIALSGRTDLYNYGGQPTYSGNSTITGGLFDRIDGVNTATGVQFVMQEGDPQHPVVCQLTAPLVAGASYSFAFDLGARANGSGSTEKYIALLYNASTGMTEKIIASDILSSLPGPSASPAYKTISGTFIPNSSASYYLLFYPSISGGAGDDFTIDRVAVQTTSISACDTDGDGIPNYLDLDSDGDGCSDALEAGATTNTTVNFQFTGAVGTNGLVDSKETVTDNGVINYYSTYNTNALSKFLATCTDTDGDGILDVTDIDDDNDGVPDADECPTCYYTAAEAGIVAKVFTGLASSTVNSAAVNVGADIPTLRNGITTSVAASDHVVAAGQTSTTSSVIYRLDYPTPVNLSSVSVIGATASWGTGSFAVLEGSTDGTNFNDVLSAPLATSAGTTKTWNVTLNTTNYYQYYRIRVSTVGSTTPTFTNYEVSGVLNTSGYIPSAHPKLDCATDTDGDGIINTKDLDSDGDGCSDALEAGATTNTTANYQFPAPYGTNGLADAKETVTDNGVINYISTYNRYAIAKFMATCTDTDGDGIFDITDIDDDNDGVPDADESPTCYYTATEAGVLAKVATGLVSSTINSIAVNTGVDMPTMHDGTSTSVTASNHVVAAGQTSTTSSIIYTLEYPTPVKLSSVNVIGATASWGTGSFAVLEGSTDGVTFTDALSAPLATSAGTTKTWAVTLNTNNYYQYYRIRVSTVGSTTPTFTNFEVNAVLNTSGYIPSAHPKPNCTTDTDGDGIINTKDLDSDGDGCSDALESGATTNTAANYQFPAPYGANGLADAKETVTDNGVINYMSTYSTYAIHKFLATCTDTDGDGISDLIDIDDDNDGVLDAEESPTCYYTTVEAGVLAKVATGLASSTVNSIAVNTGIDIPTMHDGTSTTVTASNHIVAAGQTSTTSSIIYSLEYPTPVKLSSVNVIGATASWGTGSFAVLEGSTDGITFNDVLSAPLATSAGTTKTWTVTLNANNYYQYYRIRVSTVGSTTPTFTNYEVNGVLNTSGYIPSAHPKPNCTTDTDGDGILNNRDLDSDGDGCSDASETGISGTLLPGTLVNNSGNVYSAAAIAQGGYGANGFADNLETAAESGVYTSSYANYTNATNNTIHSCAVMPAIRPDVNMSFVGVPVIGNVSTNDSLPIGSSYGTAVTVPGYTNPNTTLPVINANGSYTFTGSNVGVYKFYVTVCPPSVSVGCPTALLTITVIDETMQTNKPIAAPDFGITAINTSATLKALANDKSGNTMAALVPASVTIVSQPLHGTATVNPINGDITYTPANGYTGMDTLLYSVCDDALPTPNCNSAYGIITVVPASATHSILASDDYAALLNTATAVGNVITNDYTHGGTTVQATPQNISIPSVGTFTLAADGSYSFVPASTFSGPVNFPYRVCDNGTPAACAQATIYFLVSSASILPVRLISFSGTHQNGSNLLKWLLAGEINTHHFELRYSVDGITFHTIATITAAGNSTAPTSYQYLHTNPGKHNNFYQLLSVDKDGQKQYSNIVNIRLTTASTFAVYPNPFTDWLLVEGDKDELSSIALFNTVGQNITGALKITAVSANVVGLNVRSLPGGIYFIKTKKHTAKIWKQ